MQENNCRQERKCTQNLITSFTLDYSYMQSVFYVCEKCAEIITLLRAKSLPNKVIYHFYHSEGRPTPSRNILGCLTAEVHILKIDHLSSAIPSIRILNPPIFPQQRTPD